MHYYRIYGLTAASVLEIPDAEGAKLPKAALNADVTITIGSVPQGFMQDKKLVSLTDTWHYLVQDAKHFYMHCNGFDFEITDGSAIKVDTHSMDIGKSALITYILGSAFGVVGMQRGLVPIHGAAVKVGSAAAVITGFSGSGKSAILSALIQAGYRYIADDVSMVSTESGRPCVFPSYPQRKLPVSAVEELGGDYSGVTTIVEGGNEKYAVRRTSEWLDEKLPVTLVVEIFPVTHKDGLAVAPEMREVTGHQSLGLVLRNRYRSQFADSIGTPPERMKMLLEITSSVKTYQLIRPAGGSPVCEAAKMIAEQCFQ